jgi:hypothetical protein
MPKSVAISTVPTRARLFGREVLACHQGITGHDAALKQAEHGGHDIQRYQAVEGQKQQQGNALQNGTQQQGSQATDVV